MTEKSHPHKKTSPFVYAILIIVLAGVIGLGAYGLREFKAQEAEKGIVTCNETGDACNLSLHIHADVKFNLCGNEFVLPREWGELSGLHTHKEANLLHFHDNLKLNPINKLPDPDERLSLQEIIDVFELSPQKFCGSDNVDIVTTVNGKVDPNGLEYNWKDGDDVELTYVLK